MEITTDIVVNYIKVFIINICVYYSFIKISNNKEKSLKNIIIVSLVNIIMLLLYIPIKINVDGILPFILMYIVYTIAISIVTKNKIGYTMIISMLAYSIVAICHTIAVVIQFVPYKMLYKLFNKENLYLSLVIITLILFVLIYGFFKIKRFRNGFSFLNSKLNNEITDIIMLNISTIILIIYCLLENYQLALKKDLFIVFFIIGFMMFFTIQKMLTMYYKQKLLTDTMEEYKLELVEKQKEIDKLKEEKKNVSKITHEFYNRQKALELLVGSNMEIGVIEKEGISPNVLKMIESLTNEYSQRFENIKDLPKLELTEIPEIDNMFKYMQSECYKNNIEFKLKVVGNIYTLINNVIPKNKLETLIGDHLRDAINAVNLSCGDNKEILAVLGIKNKKYELSIFDTGIDFEVDTLVKLGLEPVTTNAIRGGTGTGFMTTFETMKETNASLVITEYPIDNERYYTKCVTIRFDGKKQYKICSYRSKEIKEKDTDNRIKIENNK